jgi:DNA-directed RNA polymerase subunit RPC12/RpoP
MVRYWCTWCGATEERETAEERVPCWRCVREFARIFRYYPRALMVPLDRDESPGIPAGARKQFEFRDEAGRLVARTQRIPPPNGWAKATGTDGR